jgi:uncharacterized protein YecT (DUF1311 family)
MMLPATLMATLTALCAAPALAQAPTAAECEETLSQARMNVCAAADHAAAEAEMTAVYEQVLAQYREQDREIALDDPRYAGAEKLLAQSQAAWAASSNDFCGARMLSSQGGMMGVSIRYACLSRLTRNRTEDLRLLLY